MIDKEICLKCTYSHFCFEERRKIYRWHYLGLRADIIAEKLGRHRSTIFRELKRNTFEDPDNKEFNGCYPVVAQMRRYVQHKLLRFSDLVCCH